MDQLVICIIVGVVALVGGFIIAKVIEKNKATSKTNEAKREAKSIIKEAEQKAESIKKDKIYQAKEKFIELKAEHENVILERDKKIANAEKRVKDKESQVSQEIAKNKKLEKELDEKKKERLPGKEAGGNR